MINLAAAHDLSSLYPKLGTNDYGQDPGNYNGDLPHVHVGGYGGVDPWPFGGLGIATFYNAYDEYPDNYEDQGYVDPYPDGIGLEAYVNNYDDL